MAILTGSNGEMRFNGIKVARCRSFSVDISRDALETTTLGDYDRAYISGIRGATGSATIIYDQDDGGTMAVLRSIFENDSDAKRVSLVLDTSSNDALQFEALLTQVNTPVAVGEATVCSVNFQVTGPFAEEF